MENKNFRTISYYDTHAKEWSEKHHGFDDGTYWVVEMDRFHKLLPEGNILEIGSGTGKDARELLKHGYGYVGIDASSGLLKIARERNPNVLFKHVAVQDMRFPENSFDGFWSVATLLHVPKDEIDLSLKKIAYVVKPGGIGFVTIKAGNGEMNDPDTGRWYFYYSNAEFNNILKRNNFEVIASENIKGENDTWLVYFVKNNKLI